MTDPKDRNLTPQGNAPSWVDEVLSSSSTTPQRPVESRHGSEARPVGSGGNWDHWPQTDAARDLRLPEDPPRPAPAAPFDSDDWVARATGGQVRDPLPPQAQPQATTTTYSAAPQTDAWGEPVRQPSIFGQPTSAQLVQRTQPTNLPIREDIGQKKLIAALLAIFLGSFGVHKFYLGMNAPGLWMLGLNLGSWIMAFMVSLMTLFIASFITFPAAAFVASVLGVVGLIEGIIYLTKSDADFQRDYLYGKKPWF